MRKEQRTGVIEAMPYPTPTPTPTLTPAFAEAASRRQAEREGNSHAPRGSLPLQGGGQEGDGGYIGVAHVPSASAYGQGSV